MSQPIIEQIFVGKGGWENITDNNEFERKLYLARLAIRSSLSVQPEKGTYRYIDYFPKQDGRRIDSISFRARVDI